MQKTRLRVEMTTDDKEDIWAAVVKRDGLRPLTLATLCGGVSRAIIAGIWVAFFQRVPAMIARTGRQRPRHLQLRAPGRQLP